MSRSLAFANIQAGLERREYFLPLLIGLLIWFAFAGDLSLSPTHVGWVMNNFDTPQHYAGWLYFRQSPLLQWPLGMNPKFGYDAPSSVVMTDSIPLLALLFKLFSAWLPAQFQYFGLWVLACFLLQAWFAYRLLRRFSPSPLFCCAGSVFFATATIFLVRVYLHPGLAAHWLILAALDLYFSASVRRQTGWLALLCVSVLVHAYLFAMVGAIWAADLLQRCFIRKIPLSILLREAVVCIVATMLTMWAAGYFVAGSTTSSDQNSRDYANLLFPLWAGDGFPLLGGQGHGWSVLLPTFRIATESLDSLSYFGLGFLLLAVCALALQGRKRMRIGVSPSLLFVALACAAMLLYSLGNDWYAGSKLLLHLPSWAWLDRLQGVWRCAARFIWPAWYLCLLFSLRELVVRLPQHAATVLVCALLAVQLWDFHREPGEFRQLMRAANQWQPELSSDAWRQLATCFDKMAILGGYKPAGMIYFHPKFKVLMNYGARNNVAVSTGWLAHIDNAQMAQFDVSRADDLRHLKYESRTFYAVFDLAAWKLARCQYRIDTWTGTLDGVNLVVPDGMRLPVFARLPQAACEGA